MSRQKIPDGLRDELLRRAGWRCEIRSPACLDRGRPHSAPLTWSHILAASRGGPWALFNAEAACGSGTTGCHGHAEHNPRWAEEHGHRVRGSIVRGEYVGPSDWWRRAHDEWKAGA